MEGAPVLGGLGNLHHCDTGAGKIKGPPTADNGRIRSSGIALLANGISIVHLDGSRYPPSSTAVFS
jgi:hypothetical protein